MQKLFFKKEFLFRLFTVVVFGTLLFFMGCRPAQLPKPKGYFKIHFPEKAYQTYSNTDCPFTFNYPVYGVISRDTSFFDSIPKDPCWMNIDIPSLNSTIYLSYKDIGGKNDLAKLVDDAHKLTFRHTVKADFIDESEINNQHGVYGLLYDVGGNAASAVQFFLTDSTTHFIRGSLYFNTVPNADSLAPAVSFLKDDIVEMIKTFRWK